MLGAESALSVLGLVTNIATARTLSPLGKGELTAVLLWPTLFAAFGGLGVSQSAVYYAGQNTDRMGVVAGVAFASSAVLGVLIGVAGWVAMPHVLADYSPDIVRATQLLFAWWVVPTVGFAAQSVLLGAGHFAAFNQMRITQQLTYAGGIVALWTLGRVSVQAILGVYVLSQGVVFVWGMILTARLVDRWGYSTALLKDMLRYGVRSVVATWASVTNMQMDQAIISVFLSPTTLGLYKVAVSSIQGVKLLGIGFGRVLLSDVSRTRSKAMSHAKIVAMATAGAKTVALAAVVSLVAMPLALPLVFGPAFAAAVVPAQILCVGGAILGVRQILYNGERGRGRPEVGMYSEIVGVGVTVVGLYTLLPRFGITGAALTSVAAYAVSLGVALVFVRQAARAGTDGSDDGSAGGPENGPAGDGLSVDGLAAGAPAAAPTATAAR